MDPQPPVPPKSQPITTAKAITKVNITAAGNSGLKVDPDPVHVKPPGRRGPRRIKWLIDPNAVPPGGRVEIDFKDYNATKGPFASGGANGKGRGRYGEQKKTSMNIETRDTDVYHNPQSDPNWYYSVSVYDKDDKRTRYIDPGVAIDEDPSVKPGN